MPEQVQILKGVWESLPPTGAKSFADADQKFVTNDAFGPVYQRRRLLGSPTLNSDGSVGIRIRGGAPILLEAFHRAER